MLAANGDDAAAVVVGNVNAVAGFEALVKLNADATTTTSHQRETHTNGDAERDCDCAAQIRLVLSNAPADVAGSPA
jgi:hypothetical protein